MLAVLSACAAAAVAHSRSSPECVEAPDRTWDLQLQLGCGKGVGVKCYTVLQGSDLAKNEGKGIFELNDVAVPGVYTLAVEVGGNVKKASISPDKTNIEFTLAPLEPGGQNEQIPYVPASWPRHNMPARDIVHCQHAPFALPCAMGGGEEGGGERERERAKEGRHAQRHGCKIGTVARPATTVSAGPPACFLGHHARTRGLHARHVCVWRLTLSRAHVHACGRFLCGGVEGCVTFDPLTNTVISVAPPDKGLTVTYSFANEPAGASPLLPRRQTSTRAFAPARPRLE